MKVAEFGPNWSDFEQLSFSTKLQLITLPSSHTTYTLTSSTNISLQNTNTRSMIIPNETLTCCISLYVGYAKVKKEHYDRIHVHGIASLTAESRNSARFNNWSLSLDCTLEVELPTLVYGQMAGMIEVMVEGIFQNITSKKGLRLDTKLTIDLSWNSSPTINNRGIIWRRNYMIKERREMVDCRRISCSARSLAGSNWQLPAVELFSCSFGRIQRQWFGFFVLREEFVAVRDSFPTPSAPGTASRALVRHRVSPCKRNIVTVKEKSQVVGHIGKSNVSYYKSKEESGSKTIPDPEGNYGQGLLFELERAKNPLWSDNLGMRVNRMYDTVWIFHGELDSCKNTRIEERSVSDHQRTSEPPRLETDPYQITEDFLRVDVDLLHQEMDCLILELLEQEQGGPPPQSDLEVLQSLGFPGEGVDTKFSVDAWEWRVLETPELEEILDSLGNMGLDERIELLLAELEKQEVNPMEVDMVFQAAPVGPDYDNESGSLGSTVYDPPAFWLEDSQTIDSGLDHRMVNMPVYHENVESINSEQLEFENWMDLHQPGYMAGLGLLDDDTSSFAQNSDADEPVEWWQSPQELDFLPYSLDPSGWDVEQGMDQIDQVEQVQSPPTPTFIHLQGCECLGCNRLSPSVEGEAEALSYPVDMVAVATRLRAVKERWLLEIDVDEVHRLADIEEREIIREHRFLEQIRGTPTIDGSNASGNCSLIPPPHKAEHSALEEPPFQFDPDQESGDSTGGMDIGLFHHLCDIEDENHKKTHYEWSKRAATWAMVQKCIRDKEVDDFEALADEILEYNQETKRVSSDGDLAGREENFPHQPP